MSILGDRIKEARTARGMSQEELAEKTGYYSGRAGISKVELGNASPPQEIIEKIAAILGVSTSWLLGIEEEKDQALEEAFKRPEMRILFSIAQDASKEDIEKAIKIIEALKGDK